METIKAFRVDGATFSIAYTTTASASTALNNVKFDNIRFYNSGLTDVFVSIGTGAQTATLPSGTAAKTCTPIAAGTVEIFSLPRELSLNVSAICASGSGTLYVTLEEGV